MSITATPTLSNDAREAYFGRVDAARGRSAEPAWLTARRATAARQLLTEGFPTTRDEEFRFTNVAPIATKVYPAADVPPARASLDALLAEATVPGLDAHEIVFVNGRFAPELSSIDGIPAGVRLTSLASSIGADPALVESLWDRTIKFQMKGFTALNSALATDGAILVVDPEVVVERPIHLLFLSSAPVPFGASVRNLVRVGHHAQVRIVESYIGEAGQEYFTNAITEVSGADESRVEYCRVQRESMAAHHISGTHLHLGRAAVFASESLSLGGAIVRNDVNAVLAAEGISCTLNGLYLVDGDRLVDNHTTIDHAKPHCESHELYKGIIEDRGRGVFNGKIFVREDAQKTDAKQTNKVMLLSDDATIDTKPQLEIFADDVKCTHGATIGQIDQTALFYLKSRGVNESLARRLLTYAFAADVLETIEVDAIRLDLERMTLQRFV